MNNDPDHQDVTLAKGGDNRSFRRLVEKYGRRSMNMALRIVRDQHEAEEVVQSAFIKVYRALPSFDHGSMFSTWLYRIVYTTALNNVRGRSRQPDFIQVTDEEELPAWIEPDIIQTMDHAEMVTAIKGAIERMDAAYSVVLDLFYLKDLSYSEIVEVTGLPIGTVKTRLHRGRSLLKQALNVHLSETPYET